LKRESEYDEGLVYVLTIQTDLYTTRIDVHVLLKWTFAQKNKKTHTRKSNVPQKLLSTKGRTCNPTPLVHPDMTKKTTFYEQK